MHRVTCLRSQTARNKCGRNAVKEGKAVWLLHLVKNVDLRMDAVWTLYTTPLLRSGSVDGWGNDSDMTALSSLPVV
ncbi:hypothetical protein NDU88_003967 [Pleurodeles waltl]|uniref:Uncharacterized protein n=1 Tax=Pleurodeles waltl TaxID=8319 RepID=A0AAV7QER5_PLEWA|nr:hypothetical protein NDU88_003967 [Pleurodeles waltl]